MCDDPFQKKLRPRFAIELHCPIRQRFPAHAIEQIAAAEGPIHNHSYPAIFRHRENALLRFAFHEGIIDLHEIHFLFFQNARDFRLAPFRVMRDADVTHASFLFPLTQGRQMRRGIDETVHLNQIELLRPE